MSLKKNQIFETTIENLSSDGSGVAHVEGQAVFVSGAAPGDVIRCRIVKALKSYAFGRIDAILAPGPGRVAPDCAVCTPCGGCGLRHLSYATECEAKTGFVRDAFARLGGFDVSSFEFSPVLALTDHTAHYRNKVQLPVGLDADGHVVTGFYAGRTHRIVPCPDCKLQPEWMNAWPAGLVRYWKPTALPPMTRKPARAACAICICARAGTTVSACCALW